MSWQFQILMLVGFVVCTFVGYALGRIDGYWKRAEEERNELGGKA